MAKKPKTEEPQGFTTEVTYQEYKGHPMINIPTDHIGINRFMFGLRKARAIVTNFEAIKAWVEKMDALEKKGEL